MKKVYDDELRRELIGEKQERLEKNAFYNVLMLCVPAALLLGVWGPVILIIYNIFACSDHLKDYIYEISPTKEELEKIKEEEKTVIKDNVFGWIYNTNPWFGLYRMLHREFKDGNKNWVVKNNIKIRQEKPFMGYDLRMSVALSIMGYKTPHYTGTELEDNVKEHLKDCLEAFGDPFLEIDIETKRLDAFLEQNKRKVFYYIPEYGYLDKESLSKSQCDFFKRSSSSTEDKVYWGYEIFKNMKNGISFDESLDKELEKLDQLIDSGKYNEYISYINSFKWDINLAKEKRKEENKISGRKERDYQEKLLIRQILCNQPKYLSRYVDSNCSKTIKTIHIYLNEIIKFLNYLRDNCEINIYNIQEVVQVKTTTIDAYLESLNVKNKFKEKTHYALKNFFKFLIKDEKIEINPYDEIELSKKTENPKISYLEMDEIELIKQNILNGVGTENAKNRQKPWCLRDYTIFMVAISTGVSSATLLKMDVFDVDFEKKCIHAYQKENRKSEIPVSDNILELIKEWMEDREEKMKNFDRIEDALFISNRGSRLTQGGYKNIIKKYSYNLDRDVSTYELHTTCGTDFITENS